MQELTKLTLPNDYQCYSSLIKKLATAHCHWLCLEMLRFINQKVNSFFIEKANSDTCTNKSKLR